MEKRVLHRAVLLLMILNVCLTPVSALSLKLLDEIEPASENEPVHIEVTTAPGESGQATIEIRDANGETIAKKEVKLSENTKKEIELTIGESEKSQDVINDEKIDKKETEIAQIKKEMDDVKEEKEKNGVQNDGALENLEKELNQKEKEIEIIKEESASLKEEITEHPSPGDIIRQDVEKEYAHTQEELESETELEIDVPDIGEGEIIVILPPPSSNQSQTNYTSNATQQNATTQTNTTQVNLNQTTNATTGSTTQTNTTQVNLNQTTNATTGSTVVIEPLILITPTTKSGGGIFSSAQRVGTSLIDTTLNEVMKSADYRFNKIGGVLQLSALPEDRATIDLRLIEKDIGKQTATFSIAGYLEEIILRKDKTIQLDLNNNSYKDISLTLAKVTSSIVLVEVKILGDADEATPTTIHETDEGEIIITDHPVIKSKNGLFLRREFKLEFNFDPDLIYGDKEKLFIADGIEKRINLGFLGKYELHRVMVEIEEKTSVEEPVVDDATIEHELSEFKKELYIEKSGIFHYAFFGRLFGV